MALTKTILKVLGLASATPPAGYAEVKEARATVLIGGESAQLPLVHLVDDQGNSLPPLTDAQLRAAALPVSLDLGTAGTDIAPPSGAAGLVGWLSGVYKRLGDVLNIRALSAATDSVSIGGQVAVSNFPANQTVSGTVTANLGTLAGAATEAKQDAVNTSLTTLNTNVGAVADAAAADDAGSASLIALTKRLLGRITTLLSVLPASLGQKASAASLPVVLASDQPALTVVGKTDEAKSYFTGVAIIPTALTTGLNYFWIRNPDAGKKIKIEKLEIILGFAGTAAATRSLYALKRFAAATATTGTVTLTPAAGQTSNPASIADIKWAAAGGTLTGATVGATVLEFGHVNQLTANIAYDRDMTDAPIVLGQNEGLVLQSDGAVVAGTTVLLSVRWIEEQTP